MCGIVGIIKKGNTKVDQNRLKIMCDSLIHRGPDAGDIFCETSVGFGHRRLSILDLSPSGNQPFISPCGRFVLVFNGEIFNYKEFYSELTLKGYQFKSTSDTEVLIYLLMEYGIEVLSRLNGFFSFAFWDKEQNKTWIARDRFGVKPLFFADLKDEFLFASEPKALFAAGLPKSINEQNLAEQFFYRYVSGSNTLFIDVIRLLPGHYITLKDSAQTKTITRWFHLGDSAASLEHIKNPYNWFDEIFHSSVQYRMISDVPVGTLLSGGLDSSSVLLTQHELGFESISSWNISFSNYQFNESIQAKQLAEKYGYEFNTHEFIEDELYGLVYESIAQNDEPLMHMQDGHLLGIARMAKKKVSVLLSGEGADEILGGYVRYKIHDNPFRYQFLQFLRYVPDRYLKNTRMKKMKKYLQIPNVEFQMMSNSNEILPFDLKGLGLRDENMLIPYRIKMLEEAKQFYPNNRFRQLLYLEQHTHLYTLNDRNDRTTMAASIECRDPFLDSRILIGVASLSDKYFSSLGKGKLLLRNSIGKRLPNYILNHPKIGLSVPWDRYFIKNEIFRSRIDHLHLHPLFSIGLFDLMDIKKIVQEFKKDQNTNYGVIRQLFFLSLWYDIHFGANSNSTFNKSQL